MDKNSKILAFLPLRSGSKRVIDKNIRIVGNKPLFVHSIETCLSIKSINKIVVSVDTIKYREIIDFHFADNPVVDVVMRPRKLATDSSKTEDAILHAINYLEKNEFFYDYALLVQATNPLTKSSDIEIAINRLIENTNLNSIFSACHSKKFYLDDKKTLIERPMTQNKKPKIHEVGCFWLFNVDQFKVFQNRIIEPYDHVIINEYDALDIDTEEDMIVADFLLSKRSRENDKSYYIERKINNNSNSDSYYGENVDPDGKVRNLLNERNSRVDFAKNEIKYINDQVKQDFSSKYLNMLSIGCGAGYAENEILNAYFKYGVEPDKNAGKLAKKVFDSFINDFFDVKNYKKNFFDLVFCHHVIEHFDDPIALVRDIWQILKPGGKLVIGTPNFDSAMARRYGDKFRLLCDQTHISLFSDFSLKQLLEDNRYKVNYIDYPYFDTKYFNDTELLKVFDNNIISPPFYGNIFTIYAEKK
jgi:N-acylneuraminate cytidylyltransferase/CMP-N,N'-diacetyllegionaminic acid synthase